MKKKRKLFMRIILPIAIVWFFLDANLSVYRVYYTLNTPHDDDQLPIMALLIDELEYLDKPDETANLRYDYDGTKTVRSTEKKVITSLVEGDGI